jgi:hypothetical protein
VPPAVLDFWRAPRQPFKFECVSTFIGLRLYFLLKLFQRFNGAIGLLIWDTRVLPGDEIAAKAGALQRFRAYFGRTFGYALALMALPASGSRGSSRMGFGSSHCRTSP